MIDFKLKATILLSTFNDNHYLPILLDSLINQTIPSEIHIRDDGSSDKTRDVIETYKRKSNIKIEYGFNLGIINSFSILLNQSKKFDDYIAFCDQDDVWLENKLEKAIESITSVENEFGKNLPILYHSDLKLIDANGNSLNNTFWKLMNLTPQKSHKLSGLLNQPIVTGCTMVINKALKKEINQIPKTAKMHDWWISLIACAKGIIISDSNSYIQYRLHGGNAIGATGFSIHRIFKNLKNLNKYIADWKKENCERILQAETFLDTYRNSLKDEDIGILEKYIKCRESNFIIRKYYQVRYGFFPHGVVRKIISLFLF